MKIVAISDTHSMHRRLNLPKGDVLVHAGDFSGHGRYDEFKDFVVWLSEQKHKHKVFIAGNHDRWNEDNDGGKAIDDMVKDGELRADHGINYLNQSSVEIMGRKFYGSPWQPDFCKWSFQASRGRQMAEKWDDIPHDVDILITHGPPYGHGDYVPGRRMVTGCLELMKAVVEIKPFIHIFGHIHEGYGRSRSEEVYTMFINASTCDEKYRTVNEPQVIELS